MLLFSRFKSISNSATRTRVAARSTLAVAVFAAMGAMAGNAHANGIFEAVVGAVQAKTGDAAAAPVLQNGRIVEGTTVTTGAGGRTTIRLVDGQLVNLAPNSEFRLQTYKYDKDNAAGDSIVLNALRGSMRFVTGLLGARSRSAFALSTPTATIGIRGTVLGVSIVDVVAPGGAVTQQTVVSVTEGAVQVTTSSAQTVVGPGQSVVASAEGVITSVPAGSIPQDLQNLNSMTSSTPLQSQGTAGGASGAVGGGVAATVLPIAAAVAAVAAIAAQSRSGGSGSVSTTGTTGTTAGR